jgi:PRC-barrel domain protein
MALPLQSRLAIATLALTLATAPAMPESPQPRPTTKAERTAVGLPIVTSDGKAIGKVAAMGTDEDNQPVLVGVIERSLGLGPEAIAIPTDLFVRKHDRIELTINEAEVNARLGRAERQR